MLNNPVKEFTYNGSRYTYPKVKLIYNAGHNFMSHQQNLNELIRALQKVDTVVVQDCWWTASTRWADIVLPATTTVERNDISSGGTYNINKFYAMKQVIAPQGDALDDFEIFRRLAELCGVELGFTEGLEPMDYVKAASVRRHCARKPWHRCRQARRSSISAARSATARATRRSSRRVSGRASRRACSRVQA